MGYFFISKRACSALTDLYSLVDNKCYAPPIPCPAGTAQEGSLLICAPCHYSCKTCLGGLTSTNCDSCDSAMNRDTVSVGG